MCYTHNNGLTIDLKTGMCTVDIWHRYVHYVVMYLTWVVIWLFLISESYVMACVIYITMDWLLILKTGMCTVGIWHRYVHYGVMYLTWVVIWWCPWQVVWEKGITSLLVCGWYLTQLFSSQCYVFNNGHFWWCPWQVLS